MSMISSNVENPLLMLVDDKNETVCNRHSGSELTSPNEKPGQDYGALRLLLLAHNPVSKAGRNQIKKTTLSSGPTAWRFGQPSNRMLSSRYTGWRMGSFISCIMIGTCLIINSSFTIYAMIADRDHNGVGTLFTGSCEKVRRMDLWLHVALNCLGTMLLGAGNYNMQCLSAPNRNDINAAHSKGLSLAIGVPSIRNLRHIGWQRTILWWLLAITALPLHLLWNSTIFSTMEANNYYVVTVAEDLDLTNSANFIQPICIVGETQDAATEVICDMHEAAQRGNMTRLDVTDCITAYSVKLQSKWSNVITVSSASPNSTTWSYSWTYSPNDAYWNTSILFPDRSSLLAYYDTSAGNYFNSYFEIMNETPYPWDSRSWVCSQGPNYLQCSLPTALINAADWKLFVNTSFIGDISFGTQYSDFPGYSVLYCLASPTAETCKLQFSLVCLLVVLCSNAIKLFVVILVLFTGDLERLITIGDAMASFLADPDNITVGACLATKYTSMRMSYTMRAKVTDVDSATPLADPRLRDFKYSTILQDKRSLSPRWFEAASWKRWLICIILCSIALIVSGVFLSIDLRSLYDNSISSLWSSGFGFTDGSSIIEFDILAKSDNSSKLLTLVLLANLPQLILSSLYFMHNGLYTCMLAAAEWDGYCKHRKPLRVTAPLGVQRSTYWLQLPWKYGIPLTIASSVMHWLLSQSIFLVSVDVYDAKHNLLPPGPNPFSSNSVITCGFSVLPLVLFIILGGLMLLILIINGFRRFDGTMPLAGSCSLAISAACHRPPQDEDATYLPVKWGAISHGTSEGPGHCCFTSKKVQWPMYGRCYAGQDF